MPAMFCICWPCWLPESGPLWSHCCCSLAACARIWRLFFVRPSTPRALRDGCIGASGDDGFAGLSALSGGGGVVAQPTRRPKAINGMEYRFIFCPCDRFQKLELEFHSAEIRDVLLDRPAGRYRPLSRNRELRPPGSEPPMEKQISAISCKRDHLPSRPGQLCGQLN
jgi:hypothetical protein